MVIFTLTTSVSLLEQNIRQLQQCINKITHWVNTNGFKISKSKTRCMHFCQLRKMRNNQLIKLKNTQISVVKEYKFLGVIFDRKLSFISHIECLKTKTTCAQQLLWVVPYTKWGADCQALLKLYRALVHSQLDYGIFIYRSARKSYLKKLDPIHHKGLRLVLGTFRTSPAVSLYTEIHEAPLQLRCEKLALQYCTKLKSCSSIPSYNCIFSPKHKQQFEQKEKKPSNLRRCPWCNGYRRRIWTRRHEFKSWTWLIAFHIALIPLGKVWIQNILPPAMGK